MNEHPSDFSLGEKVKDSITGFIGICIAYTVYLYSSPRALVVSEEIDGNIPREGIWFDVLRLSKVEEVEAGFRL